MLDFDSFTLQYALATAIMTQILKSEYIKVPFQKKKRLTALGVSVASALIALYQSGRLAYASIAEIAGSALVVFIMSAFLYIAIFKGTTNKE